MDFGGIGEDYTVTKINDYRYEITFGSLLNKYAVTLNSIGGLNLVVKNYQWYSGTFTEVNPELYTLGIG